MTAHRMPMLKAREVVRALQKLRFVFERQVGSHALYAHADGRVTTVPIHGGTDIGRGLVRKILRDIEMSPHDFQELL